MGYETEIYIPRYADGTQKTMWNLIVKKGVPPTRLMRYCCAELKESSTPNRIIATGIRGDESSARSKRGEVENIASKASNRKQWSYDHAEEVYQEAQEMDEVWDCQLITAAKKNASLVINPIFTWTASDVWEYIRANDIPYNPQYDMGYTRVGCIGCPMGGYKNQTREFADFPKYKRAYQHALDRMVKRQIELGKDPKWQGDELFNWWIQNPNIEGQMSLDFEEDNSNETT